MAGGFRLAVVVREDLLDPLRVRSDYSPCDPDDLSRLTSEVLDDEDWTVPEGRATGGARSRRDGHASWTAEIRAAQLAEAKTNVKHWRAKLLARYEHLWQEAMKAWHRSEEDRVKSKIESTLPTKTPGSDLDAVNSLLASMTRKRTKTTERQSGDAALLAKAMEALKAIRELKGLDPPKQTEITGPQGGPIQLTVREMTDEQLLALIAQEQAKQHALPVESAPLPAALPPPGST